MEQEAAAASAASAEKAEVSALEPAGSWVECDDGEGHTYYYNTATEECVWEKPEGFDGAAAGAGAGAGAGAAVDDAMRAKMQKAFQTKLGKHDSAVQETLSAAKAEHARREAEREAAVAAGAEHWVEVYDPASDAFYYYGSYSHEVTWEKPAEYVMAADDELMSAVIKIQCAWRRRAAHHTVKDKQEDIVSPPRSAADGALRTGRYKNAVAR